MLCIIRSEVVDQRSSVCPVLYCCSCSVPLPRRPPHEEMKGKAKMRISRTRNSLCEVKRSIMVAERTGQSDGEYIYEGEGAGRNGCRAKQRGASPGQPGRLAHSTDWDRIQRSSSSLNSPSSSSMNPLAPNPSLSASTSNPPSSTIPNAPNSRSNSSCSALR